MYFAKLHLFSEDCKGNIWTAPDEVNSLYLLTLMFILLTVKHEFSSNKKWEKIQWAALVES